MAHHNYLIGHNTSPDRNKTNPSRLTALTPQNQPERPLLRGNQDCRFAPDLGGKNLGPILILADCVYVRK